MAPVFCAAAVPTLPCHALLQGLIAN